MKKINTRFGEVEYDPDNLLQFPAGLIGLPKLRHFVVMPNKKKGPLFWIQSVDAAYGIYFAAALLGLPALTGTAIALPGYWLWMSIAFVMGNIMGRVLLSLLYYGMITPMGLVRRLVNDKLQLRAKGKQSYWENLPSDSDSRFERQF